MKNRIIGILVCTLMIVATISSVSGFVNIDNNHKDKLTNEMLNKQNNVGSEVNEWTMWRNDLQNTGYSESSAPNVPSVLWTFETWCIHCTPVIVDDKVYIGSDEEYFFCLDADTGEYIWDYPIPGGTSIGSPAVYEGKVYLGGVYDYIYCWNADTGKLIWTFFTDYGRKSAPVVVDGKVYIGKSRGGQLGEDAWFYCLDAETGKKLWEYYMGFYEVSSSPAIYDGKVYFGSENNSLYCFDANTGDILWEYNAGNQIISSPAVADGKVYIGSGWVGNGTFFCLDAENGSKIWGFYTGGTVFSSPAIAYGKVYFVSGNGYVYCLNAVNGDEEWSYKVSNYEHDFSSPVVADDKVYVGIWSSGNLICLDAETGELIWQYPAATSNWLFSSPAVAYGRLYYGGGYKNKIYCFGEVPLLEVQNITGGLFRVKATIKNFGNAEATNVTCKINIDGGAVIGKETTRIIPSIPAGGEVRIKSKLILGLGPINCTVCATIPEESDTRTQRGFVYLLYVKVNPFEDVQPILNYKTQENSFNKFSDEHTAKRNGYNLNFLHDLSGD